MIITKHPFNPVLDVDPSGFDSATTYEPCVVAVPLPPPSEGGGKGVGSRAVAVPPSPGGRGAGGEAYRIYYGGRCPGRDEICYAESPDGLSWTRPVTNPIITCHDEPSGWEYFMVTRPSVVLVDGLWHMWYSSVEPPTPDLLAPAAAGDDDTEGARLGHATSGDGIVWSKDPANPVMWPTEAWERLSIQCPSVLHEDGLFRLWYSGGRRYEPDAVGYATSPDGVHWERHRGNPVFVGLGGWEHRIGAFTVRHVGDWHYAFYNAMDDTDKGDGCGTSRIGMARSRDGVTAWERHPQNPIIDVGPAGAWDSHSCYKPCPLLEDGRWRIWYNAARQSDLRETIGLAETDCVW